MEDILRPSYIPLIFSETADYWLDDDGILFSYSKSAKRTIENVTENNELIKRITNGKKVPMLMYITDAHVPDKETLKFSKEQMPKVLTAIAMVTTITLAIFVMNVLFRFKKPPV